MIGLVAELLQAIQNKSQPKPKKSKTKGGKKQ